MCFVVGGNLRSLDSFFAGLCVGVKEVLKFMLCPSGVRCNEAWRAVNDRRNPIKPLRNLRNPRTTYSYH